MGQQLSFDSKIVDLTSKNIDAKKIAKCIKNNRIVERLYISWNNLGNDGCYLLAKSMKYNYHLRVVDLSSNNIYDDGAIGLSEIIKTHVTLEELNLFNNFISDVGAQSLLEALGDNKVLIWLNLESNNVSKGFMHLISKICIREALRSPKSMENIASSAGLASTGIDDVDYGSSKIGICEKHFVDNVDPVSDSFKPEPDSISDRAVDSFLPNLQSVHLNDNQSVASVVTEDIAIESNFDADIDQSPKTKLSKIEENVTLTDKNVLNDSISSSYTSSPLDEPCDADIPNEVKNGDDFVKFIWSELKNTDSFRLFYSLSSKFRKKLISSEEYYRELIILFGEANCVSKVLPKLLDYFFTLNLNPEFNSQCIELSRIHGDYINFLKTDCQDVRKQELNVNVDPTRDIDVKQSTARDRLLEQLQSENLMDTMLLILDNDMDRFNEFRAISISFRKCSISAIDYLQNIVLFFPDHYDVLIPYIIRAVNNPDTKSALEIEYTKFLQLKTRPDDQVFVCNNDIASPCNESAGFTNISELKSPVSNFEEIVEVSRSRQSIGRRSIIIDTDWISAVVNQAETYISNSNTVLNPVVLPIFENNDDDSFDSDSENNSDKQEDLRTKARLQEEIQRKEMLEREHKDAQIEREAIRRKRQESEANVGPECMSSDVKVANESVQSFHPTNSPNNSEIPATLSGKFKASTSESSSDLRDSTELYKQVNLPNGHCYYYHVISRSSVWELPPNGIVVPESPKLVPKISESDELALRQAERLYELSEREAKERLEQKSRRKLQQTLQLKIKKWVADSKPVGLAGLLANLPKIFPVPLPPFKKTSRDDSNQIHPDRLSNADLATRVTAESVFSVLRDAFNLMMSTC